MLHLIPAVSLPWQSDSTCLILIFHSVQSSEWLNKNIIYFDPFPQSRHCGVKMLTYLGASVTGVESLAYLRELKQHYDVVFVCVPNNKENIFPSILEAHASSRCR